MTLKPGAPLTSFRTRAIVALRYAYIGDHLEDCINQWLTSDPEHFIHAMDDFDPPWLCCAIRALPGYLTGASYLSIVEPFFGHHVPEVRQACLVGAFCYTDQKRDVSCFDAIEEMLPSAIDREDDETCLNLIQLIVANIEPNT
jgi:hypothetical protein